MPRPKKPTEQKRRLGNPGKRALPNKATVVHLAPVDGIPVPERPLQEAGTAAWQNTWRTAGAWLASSDSDAVLTYAETVDDYVQMRDSAHRQGFEEASTWRLRKQVLDCRSQMRQLAGNLGLSPASRAQLGVAEVSRTDPDVRDSLFRRGETPGQRTVVVPITGAGDE
jgi:phage terminase small subunit